MDDHQVEPPTVEPTQYQQLPPNPQITPPFAPSPGAYPPTQRHKTVLSIGIVGLIFLIGWLIVVGATSYFVGYHVGSQNASSSSSTSCNSFTLSICPGGPCTPDTCAVSDEPVIYLYPQKTQVVNVQVHYPAGFSYTDPAYNPTSGWTVSATPTGQLTNISEGKQYPYLIWEGNLAPFKFNMQSGFVVPGTQTVSFLQQQLAKIGLSPSEISAFIAYWQPKMSGNAYNLIHFAGTDYTDYAKLTISPRPESLLRVFMVYKPLKQPVSVTPQTFSGFERKGFTAVEWGGTELGSY